MKKRSSSQKIQKPTLKTKGTKERVTIGMDLGDKTSRYCMLSSEGEIIREGQVRPNDWTLKPWLAWRELIRSCCGRFSTAAIRHADRSDVRTHYRR
jgi:hypothetical protein